VAEERGEGESSRRAGSDARMPTAAQWCANTNASRKRVTAWNPGGGGGWSGGAWKKKYSNEEPTVRTITVM